MEIYSAMVFVLENGHNDPGSNPKIRLFAFPFYANALFPPPIMGKL